MNPTQPAKRFWLLLLVVFWAFYGLTGRDAWKADEALALAPVLQARADLAQAWLAPAPLHVWVATLTAKLSSPWLTFQDGARLASGLFSLAALLFTALAARKLFGPGFAATAMLALLGCLGLMLRMHALAPETALLAAWALLLFGIAHGRDAILLGGGLIGLALSLLFLGLRGLPDFVAGLAMLLLPLSSPEWRRSAYYRALALGLGLTALAAMSTLGVLDAYGLLDGWAREHGFQRLASGVSSFRAYTELPWLAWPLWPLALAALWHEHRRLARARELHLPLLALLAALLATLWPSWTRDGSLFPLLPPLALLAAHGVNSLKRGAAQAFYWFGVVCFLFFIFAFWIYFAALEWGLPARLAAHVARLTPSYQPGSVSTGWLLLALFASALWLLAIPLFPRAKIRPVLVWASGMALTWTLLIALFRPWMEAGWGYRPLIMTLEKHLPADACLNIDSDPAMRTMLQYHLGREQHVDCPWLLTSTALQDSAPLWQGARPRLKRQLYFLYDTRQ